MYGEIKDKLSSDADVAGYIVNETRELSLDDLMDHSDHSVKSGSVFTCWHRIVELSSYHNNAALSCHDKTVLYRAVILTH